MHYNMRIVYFTDTYEPQVNGVVTSIKLYAEILRKNGHEVYIICPSGCKRNKYVYPIESREFENYPEYKISFPSFDLIKKIEEIKPDIIHIHTPITIGVTGLAIAKILNIPTVTTYHTLLKHYIRYLVSGDSADLFVDRYTSWFFNRFPVIVPSESIKKFLRRHGVNQPIKVVPTPVDVDIVGKRSKKRNKKPILLHVGRLSKEKRVDFVLRAFKDVLKRTDAQLIITSSGPDEERLKNIAKELNIGKNVKFTGYLSVDKLRRCYSNADIFVCASDSETQGLVVLEAMINSCPVIVRNASGFRDIVQNGKNGLLFNTEKELSEKIITLLKNKRLREKIIRGGLETADEFSSENCVKKIENVYKENLKQKHGRTSSRIMYSCLLFSSFFFYWFIKNMKLSINSNLMRLFFNFLRSLLIFEDLLE